MVDRVEFRLLLAVLSEGECVVGVCAGVQFKVDIEGIMCDCCYVFCGVEW